MNLLTFLLVVHIPEDMGLPGRYTIFLCVCPHPSSLSACHTRKQYRAPCIPTDVAIHLLMLQFICMLHFFLASAAWHLQLVAAPYMAFSVIQGEFLFAPKTLLSQGSACYMQTGFCKTP